MSGASPSNLPTDLPERPTAPRTGAGMTGVGTDLGALPTERDTRAGAMTGAPTGGLGAGAMTGAPTSPPSPVSSEEATGRERREGEVSEVSPDARTGIDTRGAPPETAARAPAPKGKFKIGLYEVMEELGRGGMGAVYRAWHPMRRKFVALKVINPDIGAGGGEKLERLKSLFLREGGILMSLAHENVVQCYDANEAVHDGKPILYMALELLEGESLLERVSARGPLPPREAAEVARDLAKALQALHSHPQKIIHRDVKPANAFLTSGGGVKLLDFGLAAVADWKLTQVSMFAAGSRPYMAPEQFDGLRFCTARSDLYSLGVTIFHMVTGRVPFECDTDNAFLRAHKERSPPLMCEALPSLAARRAEDPLVDALQNVVTRLLAKRPDERYQSAAEVVAALETALGGGTILAPKVTRPETVRLRRRIAALALVLLAAAGISTGTLLFGMSGAERRTSEADALARRGEIARAEEILADVLKFNPEFAPAQSLKVRIDELKSERARLEEARTAARALAEEARAGNPAKWRDAALASRAVLERAREKGVLPAPELAALQAEAEEAEAAYAEASVEAARGEVERARSALDQGERGRAATILEGLSRAPLPPALAEARLALDRDLARAVSLAAEWAEAREALRTGAHDRARDLGARVRDALAEGGAALERRIGARAAEAEALLAAAGRGGALAALRAAVGSRDAAAARARLAAADAEGAAASDPKLVGEARALVRGDALARARRILGARGDPREAGAAAREALRALPLEVQPRMGALAAAFERERRGSEERAAPLARDRLREALRDPALAEAEAGWLLLERAEARAGLDPAREALVERLEDVTLGSDDEPIRRENPPHVVRLAPFTLDLRETTVAEYAAAVRAGRAGPSVCWPGGAPVPGTEACPVYGVHAQDAIAYAASIGRRLPTADEWEAAASVDPAAPHPRRRYPWGDSWSALVVPGASDAAPSPVPPAAGSNPHDVGLRGLTALAGGVTEWVTALDPRGKPIAMRAGGSYLETGDEGSAGVAFRCSMRARTGYHALPSDMQPDAMRAIGFRCARDVPAPDLADIAAAR
jgi:serine/threonine protein kinase/formylglycine-generating enzyme required for sulfatase activity